MEGREGHFQLAKGGARRETDLAVVVLASACSPRSQAALRSTRAIPRSRVACGAFNVEFTAVWVLFGRFRAVNTRNARILKENYLDHRRRRIKRDLEAATKHIEVSCQSSISWTFPSPVGCSGITRNTATTRKRSAPPRNATNSDLKSSACGLFRTCLVAFVHCDATAGRPGGRGHFSCLGCFSTTFGSATNQRGGGRRWWWR